MKITKENIKYYIALIALLAFGAYYLYVNKQINKYKQCCDQKTAQANNLIVNNYTLDSLLCVKDDLYKTLSVKAKEIKTKSNGIKNMVIINGTDSIVSSLTRLSESADYKK